MEQPERRFVLGMKLGADSREDLMSLLNSIVRDFERRGGQFDLITGGYSTGGTVVVVEHGDVTHDKYFEELNAWLAARKSASNDPSVNESDREE